MVDLWIAQPQKFLEIALDEGFRKFTWHIGELLHSKYEIFSWMRARTAGYGPVRMMFIAHHGAAEYTTFSNYQRPDAVYPTWAADEDYADLEWLLANNVGDIDEYCNDKTVAQEMRPVKGQRHRVVIHRIPPAGDERQLFMLKMRQYQIDFPQCEMFVSGAKRFADIFGFGFGGVDYFPDELTHAGYSCNRVVLPTGKILPDHLVLDPRYSDWYDLVGIDQADVLDSGYRILMCLRSARWANRNWDRIVPFVGTVNRGRGGKNTTFIPAGFHQVSDKDFILPAARRRLMRNLGLNAGELDKFVCDSCILQNACTLYRENSVCTVKGSDAVGLADSFGTRNVDVLLGGLTQLVKKNAERLEDAMAAEDAAGEIDPEVTKMGKALFDQGVKLAKLLDPNLAGGPKVQVNVGVGSGGTANVGISQSDPKQLMATIVAELEASGIPRDQIDSNMIKGVLQSMAQSSQGQAVQTAVISHKSKQQAIAGKVIQGD